MPFFLHPMFLPAMWLGTVMVFVGAMGMVIPLKKKECVILQFPNKKSLANK